MGFHPMTRRSLSTRDRVKCFEAGAGHCHICGNKINAGERWDAEHVIPLAQGGADDLSNLKPAHAACHKSKTPKDARDTAKVKRMRAKHIGAWAQTRAPLPGGRNSRWKKKINGEVVERNLT